MQAQQPTAPLENWVEQTGRPTLFILNQTTSLEDSAVKEVARLVNGKNFDGLDVGVVTNGGSGAAAYRIATTLHRHLGDGGKLRGLIFSDCWSAGTILALGMHELCGGDLTVLGPVDPQFSRREVDGSTTSHSARDISAGIEALQALSREAVDGATAMINEHAHIPAQQAAHYGIEFASELGHAILGAPTDIETLGGHDRVLSESRDYGMRLLSLSHPDWGDKQKEDLLNVLINGFSSHDFPLVYEEIEALGLSISRFEPEAEVTVFDLADFAAENDVIRLIEPKTKAS